MLLELKAAIAAEGPGPVRLDRLARRVGADAAVVGAALHHARRRGLLEVELEGEHHRGGEAGPAPGCATCGPSPVAAPGCRRCPLGGEPA